MVLELTSGKDKGFLFQELPDLRAGNEEEIGLTFKLRERVEEGNYRLHFFSNGLELLTSRMRPNYVIAQRARTEAYLLRNQPDRAVIAVSPRKPVYPAALVAEQLAGSATVRCRVGADGKLLEAQVTAATHPALGRAALDAVHEWKFEPAIKNHHFIQSSVNLPFDFTPPSANAR